MACSSTIGATMMISERPNRRRGISRFSARNGCSEATRKPRAVLSDAVGDKDIADTANGLEEKRQFGIFLDLAPEPGDLNIDRPTAGVTVFARQFQAVDRGVKEVHGITLSRAQHDEIMRRPIIRARSASSVGTTKSRAAMVLPSPTSARHCATSLAATPAVCKVAKSGAYSAAAALPFAPAGVSPLPVPPPWQEVVHGDWSSDRVLPWEHLNGPLPKATLVGHRQQALGG